MKQQIECQRLQVMAIVNITPDSFYAGSRSTEESEISSRVVESVEQGASMVDLGGYSTRPGASDVSPDDEFARVDRAMKIVRELTPDMPISVDTFRSSVVTRLYDKWGAFTVNDISAGGLDSEMIATVGRLQLPYIAMHSRGTPATMQSMAQYDNICEDIYRFFELKIEQCRQAGIEELTLDPGFGFAKSVEQNFELLSGLHRLCDFGLPVLVGLSRKSMIWRTLGITAADALTGSVALNWEALRQGATTLRVHDVREAVQVVRLYEELRQFGGSATKI